MARRQSEWARWLKKRGWNKYRTGKHDAWRCPCGEHTMFTAQSPSDHRAIRNMKSTARRVCPKGVTCPPTNVSAEAPSRF